MSAVERTPATSAGHTAQPVVLPILPPIRRPNPAGLHEITVREIINKTVIM